MAEATVNQQALAGAEGQGMVAVPARAANPIDAIAGSRVVRQFSKLIGLAAAIAVGTVVALWTAEPNYVPVYENLPAKEAAQVADQLTASNIDHHFDVGSGTLMVDQKRAADARLILGEQGLVGGVTGINRIWDDSNIGTSEFTETTRYRHMLEAHLAQSVENLTAVESATVHLAIPEQSIFIRNRTQPSASVMVRLHHGRVLTPGNVQAIVQMIASSVPMMDSAQVKVVDQFGRLLTNDADSGMSETMRQFDHQRKRESEFVDKIVSMLEPIVGVGKVNARVAAQLDFSAVESTREVFDPEGSVILSEQINEQESRSLSQALGIPGSLSNQPPAAATVEGQEAPLEGEAPPPEIPSNQNRSATRNFENGRIVSHTSNSVGDILRLSVAVLIDHKRVTGEDGSVTKEPYSDEQIAEYEKMVKDTIGFDELRGDSISIVNAPFLEIEAPAIEPVPAWQSLLEEAWIVNLVKQVLGALGLLLVYFIFVRPLLRSLSLKPTDDDSAPAGAPVQTLAAPAAMAGAVPGQGYAPQNGLPSLPGDAASQAALMRRKDATYDQKVDMARGMVMDDPARVANVMKQWVGEE